ALLVLALAASNVFAEITFSGEVSGTWTVVDGEGGKKVNPPPAAGAAVPPFVDASTKLGHGFGSDANLKVVAANEEKTWGGQFNIKKKPEFADVLVWWQPIKYVKATYGMIDTWRPFTIHEDVFTGIKVVDSSGGVGLQIYPLDALEIAFGLPVTGTYAKDKPILPSQEIKNNYSVFSAYAAYSLSGIADFGLGFKGGSNKDDLQETVYKDGVTYSELNLGVAVTAIENVTLQLGVFFYLPQTFNVHNAPVGVAPPAIAYEITGQKPLKIHLKAGYTLDAFDIGALIKVGFGGSTTKKTPAPGSTETKTENGFSFSIKLTPSYKLNIGKFGADLTFGLTGASTTGGTSDYDDTVTFAAKPYFEKAYGGGTLNVAFDMALTNYTNDEHQKDDYGHFQWSVPIKLKYAF
ncbi:MAG: hypothetical protein LBP19_03805, partial [Treponema sp.]|nr:hypothetical protein [Treponema sp.]